MSPDHVPRGGHLDPTLEQAARLVVRYLQGAGEVPGLTVGRAPRHLHTASLAAVWAGLRDAGALLATGRAFSDISELIMGL